MDNLLPAVRGYKIPKGTKDYLDGLHEVAEQHEFDTENTEEGRMHPLDLVSTFQEIVKDDETVTVDVGSLYIWMARHFKSYEPRHLLFSNGMQTLGVALLGQLQPHCCAQVKKFIHTLVMEASFSQGKSWKQLYV